MTPVINNSMSNNDTSISNRKRKVHFSNAVNITEIHTHRDYTTQERTSIWYTGDEYSKFKRLKKIWMLLDDDVDVDVDVDADNNRILHVATTDDRGCSSSWTLSDRHAEHHIRTHDKFWKETKVDSMPTKADISFDIIKDPRERWEKQPLKFASTLT
ncbi:hypothetical protein FRACYDRAFT_250190 [Fragilariopsis cylindrus CCMP1102]|uniref:Uncharacterized protein n=1 Tax=Fragilariopsis cylindrus CCMP1102 TaxID=635003 RepID=A0A1E7EPQ2_9STRA|nr:hypothetical protein FRACYDRAFT_250190 [Fragilariopsis cylindrus CCMP1102]|eukprot:OEU07970.1 hypothetical protein FRACYDRAFT_250190 [Fragilariopsis cylindrus CCMP1102]